MRILGILQESSNKPWLTSREVKPYFFNLFLEPLFLFLIIIWTPFTFWSEVFFWLYWRHLSNSRISNLFMFFFFFWFGDFFWSKSNSGACNLFDLICHWPECLSPFFGRCSWYCCNLLSYLLSSLEVRMLILLRSKIKFLMSLFFLGCGLIYPRTNKLQNETKINIVWC